MRIALVSMPFVALDRPPLGVSVLKAGLTARGVSCDVHCLNLAFSEAVGSESYDKVLTLPYPALVGEWVFRDTLFERDRSSGDYVQDILRAVWRLPAEDVEEVRRVRAAADDFLRDQLAAVPWSEYDVIGFSSFGAQNLASLALARRIKEAHPGVLIVVGGSNWHGVMGERQLRLFPFVDAAFLGEADLGLPAFVEALGRGRWADMREIPGLIFRDAGGVRQGPPAGPVEDLDALPAPEFDDYFRMLADTGHDRLFVPALSLETSRGCWWASRRPCLFCGLNGPSRSFRTKSPSVILREMRTLARRWRCSLVDLVDNVVSSAFLDVVLPELAADPLPVPVFLETRATVTRRHVRLMHDAGASVQSGIESLSDEVLCLMHKGTGVLENLRFLKWCRACGVQTFWNIIYGFPGETAASYEEMRELIPVIAHLPPPDECGPLALERFSAYFDDPAGHGLRDVRPARPYRYLYPFDDRALGDIAYLFDYDYAGAGRPEEAIAALRSAVAGWQSHAAIGALSSRSTTDGTLVLTDSRGPGPALERPLDELDSLLYEACEDIAHRDRLVHLVSGRMPGVAAGEVDHRLARFIDDGFMVSRGSRFLSLALPAAARDLPQ